MILLREKVGHRPGLTSSPRQLGAGCCLFRWISSPFGFDPRPPMRATSSHARRISGMGRGAVSTLAVVVAIPAWSSPPSAAR